MLRNLAAFTVAALCCLLLGFVIGCQPPPGPAEAPKDSTVTTPDVPDAAEPPVTPADQDLKPTT